MRAGDLTAEDRAEFVAVAAASTPGSTTVNDDAYDRAYEAALDAESWVGEAVDDWRDRAARRPGGARPRRSQHPRLVAVSSVARPPALRPART